MWWTILYLLPLLLCLLGIVFFTKKEEVITRGDMFASLIIFIPILNVFLSFYFVTEFFKDKRTKAWFEAPVIDRRTRKEPAP